MVGVGTGIGGGLSAAVGATTGDWSWTPIILSACIVLGILVARPIQD